MTVFALVRHGETDWNRARRIQGATDIPLNDLGREQAAAAGRLLAGRAWSRIVASPLSRASETAQIIAREIGFGDIEHDAAFVERNYGEAEGLTGIELDARFPEGVKVPGLEAREAVADRVIAGLHQLADAHPGEAIIVVAHGGVIRSVLETVAPGRHREPITNGSIHSFQHADGGLELVLFNDPLDEQSIFPYADDYDEQNPLAHRESEREEG
ncbi:histidine phosphatase family protein [Microcella alkaliphila]|uniref:Putative broad substrate specificity phosphatase n=1 Tax=Microcella alkaliphila TaxID=279828 RepID=A0A0U4WX99_9MICO|nr:histidine phosphatase family protein [Microcella alkaliphila]BAU32359.1 putative broad substrate specificity phosphatase [Microcella alkaliphila]